MINTPYHTDPDVREKIDEVLHQCVMIFQNIGKSCSKATVAEARKKEESLLLSVRPLDPEFIDRLIR